MIEGVFTAIVTPFINDKVDYDKMKELIDFQIENGINGLVPCGTTGESATQSFDEHKEIITKFVEFVDGRVPVIAGTGSNNTAESLELTQFAKKAGVDGVLIITPYYNKPTQEGLVRHFSKIANSVDVPIVLYNVPSRTGINMLPETVVKLADIDNIVAVKEASGNLAQVCDIIRLSKNKIKILSGDDFLFFPMLLLGAHGVISTVSNIVPKDFTSLYKMVIEGKIDAARELQYKLIPLIHGMFLETNPIPVKTALKMMGKLNGEMRLPLCNLSEANQSKLREIMFEYGLK